MTSARDQLSELQCHFNWGLSDLDNSHAKPMLNRMEEKLHDKDLVLDTPFINKWSLKLSYAYELFQINNKSRALDVVEETIREAITTEDSLFREYSVSFLHVARSLQVIMLEKDDFEKSNSLLSEIKPFVEMDEKEKSGVLGLYTNVLRWYGPVGNKLGLDVIRRAILLNPRETEWKIVLAILLHRVRHFNKSRKLSLVDVSEPEEILEALIKMRGLPLHKRVTCQYLLAVIHKDLIIDDANSEQSVRSKAKVVQLCREISRAKATSPMVVSFCAQQLCMSGDSGTAISMIEQALEKLPRHIGLNTTACNIYKKQRMYDKAFDCAQIAYKEGGYGAAWLYLEFMCRRNRRMDYESFFQDLIRRHTGDFEVQIHVGAALFYFFVDRKIVNGCIHMEKALTLNPTYEGINNSFCYWCRDRVNPLEITYNQTLVALASTKPYSDQEKNIIRRVQEMIEVQVDVTRMNVSSACDLVEEGMKGKPKISTRSYPHRSNRYK